MAFRRTEPSSLSQPRSHTEHGPTRITPPRPTTLTCISPRAHTLSHAHTHRFHTFTFTFTPHTVHTVHPPLPHSDVRMLPPRATHITHLFYTRPRVVLRSPNSTRPLRTPLTLNILLTRPSRAPAPLLTRNRTQAQAWRGTGPPPEIPPASKAPKASKAKASKASPADPPTPANNPTPPHPAHTSNPVNTSHHKGNARPPLVFLFHLRTQRERGRLAPHYRHTEHAIRVR